MKRLADVAILGAGPSGLAACKAALEEGLVPVVFEKQRSLGGLWSEHGKAGRMALVLSWQVWSSLRTNLSKCAWLSGALEPWRYTCAFSDFPWPKEASDFPRAEEVRRYLHDYAEAKQLLSRVRLGCCVEAVRRHPEGWRVTWRDQEEREEAGT